MTWIKATKTLLAKLCNWIPNPEDPHHIYHKSNKLSRPDCPPESNARFPFLDLEFFWTCARRECISTGKERKVSRNKVILLKTLLHLFFTKRNFGLEMPFICFELQDSSRNSADFGNIWSVFYFLVSVDCVCIIKPKWACPVPKLPRGSL